MGFFEILVIAVITLVVVGPERMPDAVRSIALTIGRVKRSFRQAKTAFEKEIGADDIRRQLHNEEVMHHLKATKAEMDSLNQHEQTHSGKIAQPESTEEPR